MNKKVILYVDDQKRDTYAAQIQEKFGAGQGLRIATNAIEALDTYNAIIDKQEEISVLVADLGIVCSKGSELLPKLNQHFPDAIKIILIPSGMADLSSLHNVNINFILIKPIEQKQLLSITEKAVQLYQLQAEAQTQHRYLRSLVRAEQELATELDPNRIINRLMQYALNYSNAERAYFIFLEKGKYRIEAITAADPADSDVLKNEYLASPERFVAELSKTINEALQDDTFPNHRAIIFLKNKGKNIAYLYIENTHSRVPFLPLQYDLLQLLVTYVGVVLENAELNHTLQGKAKALSQEIEKDEEYQMMFELTKKDIQDSNRFAEAVQRAFLSSAAVLKQYFPDSFLLFKPQELVSSDFYWFSEKYYKYFVAAGDSTARGVRGAFLTLIVCNQLEQLADEALMLEPGVALGRLDENIGRVFGGNQRFSGVNLALCAIDPTIHKLEFAGANRSLVIYRKGSLHLLAGTPQSLGANEKQEELRFEVKMFSLESDDIIYLFSDRVLRLFEDGKTGIANNPRLLAMIESVLPYSMEEQANRMQSALIEYAGENVTQGDLLVVGLRIGQALLE